MPMLKSAAALTITAGLLTACMPTTSSSSNSSSHEPAAAAASAAGVGTPVSDGKLQFVVTGVDRSAIAGDPTNEFMQQKPKGEFVNVHLTITNTGNEARSFFAANQKLIINGNKYDAASILGVPGDGDNINPGLSVESVASFDVPPGAQPQAIELHDSLFSGGTTVNLQ